MQELLTDGRYSAPEIVSTINFLKDVDSATFSYETMSRAFSGVTGSEKGSWSAKELSSEKPVLILASGGSAAKYATNLKEFIQRNEVTVLCLNLNDEFSKTQVDAYIACHDMRINLEADRYKELNAPIILHCLGLSGTL